MVRLTFEVDVAAEIISMFKGSKGSYYDPPEDPEVEYELFFLVKVKNKNGKDEEKFIPVPRELANLMNEKLYDDILDAAIEEDIDRKNAALEFAQECRENR